jgi:hypothetical protein
VASWDLGALSFLRAALNVARWDRLGEVVIDFAAGTFCEHHMPGLLSSTHIRLAAGGRGVTVRGAKPRRRESSDLSGLSTCCHLCDENPG